MISLLLAVSSHAFTQIPSSIFLGHSPTTLIFEEASQPQPDAEFIAQSEVSTETFVVREENVDFELLGCNVLGGASTPFSCQFLIANRSGIPRSISLHRDSRTVVIDKLGNQIRADRVEYGTVRRTSVMLPNDVPIAATVYFRGTPQEDVRLIQLSGTLSEGGGRFIANFDFNE